MTARRRARRRFLRQGIRSLAVLGTAGILRPESQAWAATERPLLATIGLRNQGWTITEKSFSFADFAAFADVDAGVLGANVEKAATRQKHRPEGYADYRKILDRKDVDAVLIATPDHWHTKVAVEAMRAGKDVYCEKPLTLTIAEGKLIEQVVKETGRIVQVGTMQRTESDRRFLQAIALVKHGRIGRVRTVTCSIDRMEPSPAIPVVGVPKGLDWDFWLGPAPKVDYRALPEPRKGYGGGVPLFSNCHYSFRNWHEYSGGKVTDWGAHHVDIATWALGAGDTGPSRVTPVDFSLPVPYRDGFPTVPDRYNAATKFTIKVDMPGDVELVITSEGDNGI
ncbi:MAG: Gfo/Idh/MocA family protein, partial [Planctomycetia bacterium]